MAAGQGSTGVNRLLRAQIKTVKKHAPAPTVSFDIGTIDADLGLALDRLNGPVFPKGSYYILDYINGLNADPDPFVTSDTTVVTVDTGGSPSHAHNSEPHTHTIPRPQMLSPLVQGDRVFVALMGTGTIPIILGRIRNSSTM